MTATVNGPFDELKADLEITGLQASTVSGRQENVRDVVQEDFGLASQQWQRVFSSNLFPLVGS